jgi:flagellin
MSFSVNTNINALNAQVQANSTNKALSSSLEKLSSGLRINKAADDASGMAIADSLKSQSSSLGQAIKNANDAVGVIQIADNAMDEQLNILNTIKTKATQAAQDGQTTDTREAIQADITKLLGALDNIATTTSFNGQSLLNGSYTNKSYQVGAYSQQTVDMTINSTHSSKIGDVRFETGTNITTANTVTMTFSAVDGQNDITLESVVISNSVGTGIGVLADTINKNSDKLGGIKASWTNEITGSAAVATGDITDLKINGINIGNVSAVSDNDNDGRLVQAINDIKDDTGVEAYTDEKGQLNLRSLDGRGIVISASAGLTNMGLTADTGEASYGRLTLSRAGSKDIVVATAGSAGTGFSATGSVAQKTINLQDMKGTISKDFASAIGNNANANVTHYNQDLDAGVGTLAGAMALMEIADASIRALDKIRSEIGSTQNQLDATINNISVTQVNVTAAESQIRDVDFASESAEFKKNNILAQAGSYAMSQAQTVAQNVQKLLQ